MFEPIKRCSTCGGGFPLTEFHRRNDTADGRQHTCKYCKERYMKTYILDYYAAVRRAAVEVYGGRCEWFEGCDVEDPDELEFDHPNGDGWKHRKTEGTWAMTRRIALTGERIDDEFELRLLCKPHHKEFTSIQASLRLLLGEAA